MSVTKRFFLFCIGLSSFFLIQCNSDQQQVVQEKKSNSTSEVEQTSGHESEVLAAGESLHTTTPTELNDNIEVAESQESKETTDDLKADRPQDIAGAFLTCSEGLVERNKQKVYCAFFPEQEQNTEHYELVGKQVSFAIEGPHGESPRLNYVEIEKGIYRFEVNAFWSRSTYSVTGTVVEGEETLVKQADVREQYEYLQPFIDKDNESAGGMVVVGGQ